MRRVKGRHEKSKETKVGKKLWMRVASFVLLGLLAIPLIILLYMVFSPDYMVLIVKGESMKPTFEIGDVIVLRTYDDGFVEEGQIIAFKQNGFTVTHRVVSTDGMSIKTRGDADEDIDPWELSEFQIRGTYWFKIPCLGYLANFFRSKKGTAIIISAAVIFLIGLMVYEHFNSNKSVKGVRKKNQHNKIAGSANESERRT